MDWLYSKHERPMIKYRGEESQDASRVTRTIRQADADQYNECGLRDDNAKLNRINRKWVPWLIRPNRGGVVATVAVCTLSADVNPTYEVIKAFFSLRYVTVRLSYMISMAKPTTFVDLLIFVSLASTHTYELGDR
jgi:hypothetical protein